MGAAVSILIPIVAAVSSIVRSIRSTPPKENPVHAAIKEKERLRKEQEEREHQAKLEAERLAQEAEIQKQKAREAEQAAERARMAAKEEADRLRKETEKAREEARRREEELQKKALEAQRAAEAEIAQAKQEAEEERRAAEERAAQLRREAEDAQIQAQRREKELRETAEQREKELREEALRRQQLADEERQKALEAQMAAEAAIAAAEEEARRARAAEEKAKEDLLKGIQPVVMPTTEELRLAKERIDYRDGLYHFAVAGLSGSGKSSLINALRGFRNRDPGAAATGITETTLRIERLPDSNSANPFVWYDVPGAGTLQVRDWQYFNEQGLYVFDAIIVLVDNRFTATDIAILRNCHRFGIPTYIVRSKSDIHVRNEMIEWGYDSQDEDQDPASRAELEREAKRHLISATRKNIKDNLHDAPLPDQRVYLVSNTTLLNVVKDTVKRGMREKIIDEYELLNDLLSDAHRRRVADPQLSSASSSNESPS